VTEQAAAAKPAAKAPATGPLTAQEQAYLGRLLARQASAAGTTGEPVQMKVEPPHESISYGGLTVGTEFTTVPAILVAAVTTAAEEAGVTITTQES
jgi:hypothetical protein